MKKVPVAVITLKEAGIHVQLNNWEGVSDSKVAQCYDQLMKMQHQFKAKLVHAQRVRDTQAAKIAEALTTDKEA